MRELDRNVKRADRRRLLVQALWTAFTNGYILGFLEGRIYTGRSKLLCVPGLNCYSCPGALGSCPIGALQAVISGRSFQVSCYVSGLLILFGSVFGRLICGFLCPFGLVQDLLYRIPLWKKLRALPGERWLRRLRYAVLVFLVLLLPALAVNSLGIGKPWFCQYLCPAGTLMGGIPLVAANPALRDAAGALFCWKTALLLGIVYLSIRVPRPFCRYLCPLGAVYGWFNPVSFYRLCVQEAACVGCGRCREVCPMDLPVWKQPNSTECIRCGRCVAVCPVSAIEREKICLHFTARDGKI